MEVKIYHNVDSATHIIFTKKKKKKPRLGNELNIKKRLQKGLEKRLKCRYITLIPHGFKIPVAHL